MTGHPNLRIVPPLQPVWDGPADVLETASDFHAHIDRAERGARHCRRCDKSHLVVLVGEDGVCGACRRAGGGIPTKVEPQRQSTTKLGNELTVEQTRRPVTSPKVGAKSRLFTVSRERTARAMDAIAVALLLILAAVFGCIAVLLAAPKAKADNDYGADPAVAWAAHYAGPVCATIADYPSLAGLQGIMNSAQDDGLTARQAGEAVALSVLEVCPRYEYLLDLFVSRYGPKSSVA